MKISNAQLAFECARKAQSEPHDNKRDLMLALAQALCDQPTGLRPRVYVKRALALPESPDDLWAAPLPPPDMAKDELRAAIAALNDGFVDGADLTNTILLRVVSWKAMQLSRCLESVQRNKIENAIHNNGNHSAGIFHPPMYVPITDPTPVKLDTAAGRTALMADAEMMFPAVDAAKQLQGVSA